MKLYYKDNLCTIIQGDCLEVMGKMVEKNLKFDAIITDPPYGTTACKWDTIIPFDKMWELLEKLIYDKSAICIFGSEPFSSMLRMSNLKYYKYDWIWNKKSAGNILIGKYQPLRITENISVFCKTSPSYYPIFERGQKDRTGEKHGKQKTEFLHDIKSGEFMHNTDNKPPDARYPKNIIEISKQSTECANGKSFHSTQKPVVLMEYLINTFTQENNNILDFTMGVGSTLVAAKKLNRKCYGIELEEKYCEISKQRLIEIDNKKNSL